jgi:SRSO17 transposase
MDRRFDTRLREMLAQAQVSPDLIKGLLSRLETFVQPFTASLAEPEQRRHTVEYLAGLLSKLKHKTGEGIAYLHDQERQGLQKFIGLVPWDDQLLLRTLTRQVGADLGEADGVIVFDPSAFAKKGTASVGVQRQWCGRLGKKENCQVGVYMAYVSRKEHAIVDTRLYLPKGWTQDRSRCKAAGVPRAVKFRTRHELALEMLEGHGAVLPHAWVAGDDEMGRPVDFRLKLRGRGERYLLAVPSNTLVRDHHAAPPEYAGHGPHPQNPFVRVDRWRAALPESAWTTVEVRDGEKGPLTVDVVKCRVRARSCSSRGSVKRTVRSSMIIIYRIVTRRCRWRNWPAWPRRHTGSKSVSSAPRGRRAWPTIRCGTGSPGITTKPWRCWPRGS